MEIFNGSDQAQDHYQPRLEGIDISTNFFEHSAADEFMFAAELDKLITKPENQKKTKPFTLELTDSEDNESNDENGQLSEENSNSLNQTSTPKVKRESKKQRQQYAEFFGCVEILIEVYSETKLDAKKLSELSEEQREVIFSYLDKILNKSKLEDIKKFQSQKSSNSTNKLALRAPDFSIKKNRIDEVLKLVTSQALKKLYHNFMKMNGINKSFNPKKYTKRAEINRKIFVHYFKREPVGNEHMRLFLIKNGVTREWFEGAVCGNQKNPAFIEDLLRILGDEKFFQFYMQKVDSMIRRILGVVEFAEDQDLLNNEVKKAIQIKSKLQGGVDPKKAKKPKMPCHRFLFQKCVKDTIVKIQELAEEKHIRLSSRS